MCDVNGGQSVSQYAVGRYRGDSNKRNEMKIVNQTVALSVAVFDRVVTLLVGYRIAAYKRCPRNEHQVFLIIIFSWLYGWMDELLLLQAKYINQICLFYGSISPVDSKPKF